MYTRVVAALVSFVVARVDLAVANFFPGATEVGLARTWVEKCSEHIASAATQFAASVTRVDLAIVAVDLNARSFSLVVAQRTLLQQRLPLW